MQSRITKRIDKYTELLLRTSPTERQIWVEKLASQTNKPHEKYVIYMLYIYGMRPAELMQIRKESFESDGETLRIFLPTVKRGDRRIIDLDIKETPFLKWIVKYVKNSTTVLPESWNDPTNINAVFKKVSDKLGKIRISPYVFRKHRLSYLAIEQDASAYDLQVWKGAKDMRSVQPYIRMKPITKFGKKIR